MLGLIKKAEIKIGNPTIVKAQYIDTAGNEHIIEKEFEQSPDDEIIFAMGCYEIYLRVFHKEEEIERLNKLIELANEDLSDYRKTISYWTLEVQDVVSSIRDFILYLEKKRKKVENGIRIDELEMEYSKCMLTIKWKENGEEKRVIMTDEEEKELLFSNLELKIIRN
jgi:hypothetical protein